LDGAVQAIAVDWSGSARTSRGTCLARAGGGRLLELRTGLSRKGAIDAVIAHAARDPELVVGLDFAFSAPAWWLRHLGLDSAPGLWGLATAEGERWLAECEPPFWGRPGRPRPALEEHFRLAEQRVGPVAGIRPKSVFQIGGAGAVGTGSIRGMPWLSALHEAGFAIWPFDETAWPVVVEIWPRLFTGPVVKRCAEQRRAHLGILAHAIPAALLEPAAASEDAFDAVVSALALAESTDAVASLQRASDPTVLLEGDIFAPAGATMGRAAGASPSGAGSGPARRHRPGQDPEGGS
jgi:hypothetical protein